MIFELARSEQTYTFQRPMDYATFVLAGAIAAGWRGPVFIQGDHYQFNAKKYAADPEAMTEEIRRACRLAIDAGYRNIDIDSSTLVDLSKPDRDEEQRENYVRAAELTALIRSLETDGVTVSVGGEIGEVGKQNSTADELGRTSTATTASWPRGRPGATGLSKVSVQTGTSPRRRAAARRRRRRGQARLRGPADAGRDRARLAASRAPSSTARRRCPTSCSTTSRRSRRPRSTSRRASRTRSTTTRRSRPSLMDEIYAWCEVNAADERKDGQTDEQFLYTTRKKAIGPFKRQLWDLETQDEILAAQGRKLGFLFTELRVNGSMELVERYVTPGRRVRGRCPSRSPSRSRAEPAAMTAGAGGAVAIDGTRRRSPSRSGSRRRATSRASATSSWRPSPARGGRDRRPDPRRRARRLAVAGRGRRRRRGSSATC